MNKDYWINLIWGVMVVVGITSALALVSPGWTNNLDKRSQMLDPVVQINKNCSAVVVSSEEGKGSFLLTADHCVQGTKKFNINIKGYFNGFESLEPTFSVVAQDPKNDLAVIHTPVWGLEYALIATQKPTEGDQVWTVGFPLGMSRKLSTGFYGQDVTVGSMNHQEASSLIAGGNSGGGLFWEEDGVYVLGGITSKGLIHSMIPQMFTPIGLYVDLEPIHEIIKEAKVFDNGHN